MKTRETNPTWYLPNMQAIKVTERMYSPVAASTPSTIEETAENLLKAADHSPNLAALNDAATSRRKRVEEVYVSNKKGRVDITERLINVLELLKRSYAVNRDRALNLISLIQDDVLISLVASARESTEVSALLRHVLQTRIEDNKVKLMNVLKRFQFQANDKEPLKHPWVDFFDLQCGTAKARFVRRIVWKIGVGLSS
ncbi:hypothetical protein PsorP6_015579 [Peronosclerospora sorghi]|uniref:Uncharacterized protein n=1 Tax=Peronosclerospora sorghi TaxID=230839 RepID=A0ACC0WR76_9STRA|nr:hypothetical protein PsorP6_015579 [Peronosclerospora sorghi]